VQKRAQKRARKRAQKRAQKNTLKYGFVCYCQRKFLMIGMINNQKNARFV
jgi:hypothetical protein